MKKVSLACLLALLVSTAGFAQKTYVILSKVQGKNSTAFASKVAAAGGAVNSIYEDIGVVTATSADPDFAARMKSEANVQGVAEDPEINWIPNEAVQEAAELGDPTAQSGAPANAETFSAAQWNLRQIHADQTAANGDRGNTVARARVAVLDSGIVTNHIDIAANLNLGLSKSFVPTEPSLDPPTTAFNHGTHVAGLIAAPVNGIGTQGVAPEAEIVAVKVLRASGSGSFAWLIDGIEYASGPAVHADVINMSLGATFDGGKLGQDGTSLLLAALNRSVNHATQRGTLMVSAAGNEAVNLDGRIISIPAQSGNGMAVSATGPIGALVYGANAVYDRLASYSNYGQSVVNVAAPGGDAVYPGNELCTAGPIVRACWIFDLVLSPGGKGNRYFFAAGTSMAAPHVSGLAALIVGKYGHMNPSQLKAKIEQSAADILKPGADAQSGRGRIDATAALR